MKRIVLLAATGCLITALYLISPYHQDSTQTVQLVQPEVCDIRDTVTLHGSVTDPNRKKLYVNGSCRVLEVYVEEGESVVSGQPLILLEKTDEIEDEQAAAASVLGQLEMTLQAGDIEKAEAMLEEIVSRSALPESQEDSSNRVYQLCSPIDGMVMSVTVQAGQSVNGLLSCLEITSLEDLMIEVSAGETVVGQLKEAMQCDIAVPAFCVTALSGKITGIRPYAQETGILTGTTAAETMVYVSPTEACELLRPGYRATVKVALSLRKNAILVPYEAISQDEAGNEYVLKFENNKLVKSIVLTGSELENQVEICSGITENDLLVIQPHEELEGEAIKLASYGSADTIR